MLEGRQLQFFAAVYEEGGFSQAAVRQNSTQPAISLQISRLEARLNVRLFERHARGAVPTEAGRRLYAHALGILRGLADAENDLGEFRGAISGSLAVGLPQTLAQGVLDPVVDFYTRTYSGVRLRVVQASSGTLQSMILGKQLDVAVVTPLPRGGPLSVRRIYSDRMMLVSGPGRGLTQGRPCELGRIPNLRLIVPSPLHGTRGLIDDFLRSANIAVHQLLEIDGIAGMLNLVRATTWSALLPFIAVARTLPDDDLIVSPILDGLIPMDYFLAHLSTTTLSPAAMAFIEVLDDALKTAKLKQSSLMA